MAMPVVFERGESVFQRLDEDYANIAPKHVTDNEFMELTARLTDKCNRQREELNKAQNASNKAQLVIDSCKAVIDRVDNYIAETPRELQREFNVIAYGPNHTVDKKGNVTMTLKDAHSCGGVLALANQAGLRRQQMANIEAAKTASYSNSARAQREARAASRERFFHQ